MNVKAMLNIDDGELIGLARLVALELTIHCDRKRNIRIGQKELSEHIGISRVTVAKIFDSLEDWELIERMGHGRYRLTESNGFVDPEEQRSIPRPKGVDAEAKRLHAIRRPDQAIAYGSDGWPVLVDRG